MRRTEAYVRESIIEFLRGKSDWFSAGEIAEGIGIGYADNIYIPPPSPSPFLFNIQLAVKGLTLPQKTDFQQVLDNLDEQNHIQCVVSDDDTFYYHSV